MDGSKKIVEVNVIVGEIFARKKFFHYFFFRVTLKFSYYKG